ncbi:hypothetical protein ABZ897_59295 [Nonomuraea sp. NPDC046802]|uniref:hypothetical protein n=1 Tax=Nonomuraea sp. NPDC046802 TaxID=3154919 RepID=UPI0033F3754F
MLVVAHLWAHARAAEQESHAHVASVASQHGGDHDHHADHAHGGTFLLPAGKPPLLVKAMPLPVLLPIGLPQLAAEPDSRPPEQVPKCGHRERAVQHHTLEVYRP